MFRRIKKPSRGHLALSVLALGLAAAVVVGLRGQGTPDNPDSIIQFLNYRSGRPPEDVLWIAPSPHRSMREYQTDRAAAKSLVSLGPAAIPALERALESLRLYGRRSEYIRNSGWLLLAFARLKGPTAVSSLVQLSQNSEPKLMARPIDRAISLALGLTSYVSSSRPRGDAAVENILVFIPTRYLDPRDALDRLILAIQNLDPDSLEQEVAPSTPRANAELRALLAAARPGWGTVPPRAGAVGYRFQNADHLLQPEETLEGPGVDYDFRTQPEAPEISAAFTDASGRGCGAAKVAFVRSPLPGSEDTFYYYSVDESGLEGLVRTVESCAGMTNR